MAKNLRQRALVPKIGCLPLEGQQRYLKKASCASLSPKVLNLFKIYGRVFTIKGHMLGTLPIRIKRAQAVFYWRFVHQSKRILSIASI